MSFADAISVDSQAGFYPAGEVYEYRSARPPLPVLKSTNRYRDQYSYLSLITDNFPQAAVESASDAAFKVVEVKRLVSKNKLISLLGVFHEHGYSAVAHRNVKISKQSLEASAAFLQLLPETTPMPHVLPDGEDGVILAWDGKDKKTFVTIENWVVHCVQDQVGVERRYIDNVDFRPNKIPDQVLSALNSL